MNTTTDRPGAAFFWSFFLVIFPPAFLGLRRHLIFKFHRVALDFFPELKKNGNLGLVQNPYEDRQGSCRSSTFSEVAPTQKGRSPPKGSMSTQKGRHSSNRVHVYPKRSSGKIKKTRKSPWLGRDPEASRSKPFRHRAPRAPQKIGRRASARCGDLHSNYLEARDKHNRDNSIVSVEQTAI